MKDIFQKGYLRHWIVMSALLYLASQICIQDWVPPFMRYPANDLIGFAHGTVISFLGCVFIHWFVSFCAGTANEIIQESRKGANFDWNDVWATSAAGITVPCMYWLEGFSRVIALIVCSIITLYFFVYLAKLIGKITIRVPLFKKLFGRWT